jgi:O-antigen ligase
MLDLFKYIIDLLVMLILVIVMHMYRKGKPAMPSIVFVYLLLAPYRAWMSEVTPITDTAVDLLLLTYFLKYALKRKLFLFKHHLYWLVMFLIAVVCYAVSNSNILLLFQTKEVRFHIGIALLLTLMWNQARNKTAIKQILEIYVWNASLLAVLDLLTYLVIRQDIICNTLSNKNFVSAYLMIGVNALSYFYETEKKNNLLFFLVVILLDILAMRSTAVILALLVAGVFYIVRKFGMARVSTYWLLIIGGIIIGVISVYIVVSSQAMKNSIIAFVQKSRDSEDYTRLLIWREAVDTFKKNFLFGIGPDKFRDTVTGYNFPTHNDYLKILAETGIIGMTGFCVFVFGSIKKTLRISDEMIVSYLMSVCVGMCIFILFHGYINYVTFWVVLSFSYFIYYIETDEKRKTITLQ